MPAAVDLTGQRFGRLVAMEFVGRDAHQKRVWRFRCDCGGIVDRDNGTVKSGHTKSCGCLGNESRREPDTEETKRKVALAKRKHGSSECKINPKRVPEYGVWKTMRQRCNNPKCRDYPEYGGRGITVCKEWDDFSVFLADMGPRPSNRHSINRIENNEGYHPGNCNWATNTEQANNRRKRRWAKAPKETATCPSL